MRESWFVRDPTSIHQVDRLFVQVRKPGREIELDEDRVTSYTREHGMRLNGRMNEEDRINKRGKTRIDLWCWQSLVGSWVDCWVVQGSFYIYMYEGRMIKGDEIWGREEKRNRQI